MSTEVSKRVFNEKEAAIYLGVSRSSLRQGRMNGCRVGRMSTPAFVQLGRKVGYLIEDLNDFLIMNRRQSAGGLS